MQRREVVRIGGLSALGLGLSQLLSSQSAVVRAAAAAGGQDIPPVDSGAGRRGFAAARNCILIWLDGGPSHLDMWDLKPEAPAEVRGPLSPISTSVPDIQISECFPMVAQQMRDIALIRSMTSPLGEHNLGAHYVLTGYQPSPVLEYPSFHAVGCHQLPGRDERATAGQHTVTKRQQLLPSNVAIPNYAVGGAAFSGHGFLPPQFGPFEVSGDPAAADFQVRDLTDFPGLDLFRLSRRRQFVQKLAELDSVTPESGVAGVSPEFEQAFQMVTSVAAREAFDLKSEPPNMRQRYGMKTIGQSCLLARRLVERGVRFVTVNNRGWDTHEQLYTRLKEGYTGAKQPVGLIPSLDLALAALVSDLRDRGLLQETLIVVMGEFGRTPKLNAAGGRDHWPRVFSVALAGGGVQGGQVIGSSDRTGESPLDRPVSPEDLVRSIYHLLGIQPESEMQTRDGRPVRVVPDQARMIGELLS